MTSSSTNARLHLQVPEDFYIYKFMVHDSGHALGWSGFSSAGLLTPQGSYEMSHPTIDDSVMNYWKYTAIEPDCSPHPFDIMAIYALYRAVP